MSQFTEDFQNLGLLLLLCFSIALIAAGIILIKTRFFDTGAGNRKRAGPPVGAGAGRLMIILGAILAFTALLFLIFMSFAS